MRRPALALFAAVLAAGLACRSAEPVSVRIEMPGVSPFPPGAFSEIIVAGFRDDAPPPDFEPGPELHSYLFAEIARAFKGSVTRQPLLVGAPDSPTDPARWKEAGTGHDGAIFLTGAVRLSGEVRKALQGRTILVDGPFKTTGREFIERLRWTFSVDLFVISAPTGETLWNRSYHEEREYIDLDVPAEFAFSELAERVRNSLLPTLLGTTTIETRMLLRR